MRGAELTPCSSRHATSRTPLRRIATDRWRRPGRPGNSSLPAASNTVMAQTVASRPARLSALLDSSDPTQRIAAATGRIPTGRPRSDAERRSVGLGSRRLGRSAHPVDHDRRELLVSPGRTRCRSTRRSRRTPRARLLVGRGVPPRGRRHDERPRWPTSPPTEDGASGFAIAGVGQARRRRPCTP